MKPIFCHYSGSRKKLILVGNVPNNWLKFKRNTLKYSFASSLSWEPNTAYQTLVFLTIIGKVAYIIYDRLKFHSEEDKIKLDIMIKTFEEFFTGATHEADESYKFHLEKHQKA